MTGATSATPVAELYRVTKMKIPKVKGKPDRSMVIYNTRVTLSNIPEEAYRYQLGARSAIEWIIDRYQVKTDTASGIVNDPNDWSPDPRYIIDLLSLDPPTEYRVWRLSAFPSMSCLRACFACC